MIKKDKYIYALGFFDGVHLGHQALIRECVTLAAQQKMRAAAVTFTSHPDAVVSGSAPWLINTEKDRQHLLRQFGADTVVELPFDEEMKHLCWRDFIRLLRSQYNAEGFVCGEDFRFGYQGEGNASLLQEYCKAAGLACMVVPEQQVTGIRVSSTYIRKLLEDGDMEQAVRFLGHAHVISGKVIPGRGLGHTIGIPTANLTIPEGIVCPQKGVYACKAMVNGQEYLAVTNIGSRPTVDGHHVTVEPWILDFDGDLYGKEITLAFYKYLRPEKKFGDLGKLKAEIEKNEAQTREFFEK